MNTTDLPNEYLAKAKRRRLALTVLRDAGGHDDVVRETQELVELLLKGLLRRVGVDPPKWHDVGRVVESHQNLFNDEIRSHVSRIVKISSRLRKDRELSFYGDDDFLPSQNYDSSDSDLCLADADFLIDLVQRFFNERP